MIKELMSFILLSSIIGTEFLITPTVDKESSNGLQSSAHLDIDYGTSITCLNPTQVISSGNLFISFESEGEISELSCEGDGLLIDYDVASNEINCEIQTSNDNYGSIKINFLANNVAIDNYDVFI